MWESPHQQEIDIMHSRFLLALGAAGWLIAGTAAFADEVSTTSNPSEASQTMTTTGPANTLEGSMAGNGDAIQRPNSGNSVEWRRADHSGSQRTFGGSVGSKSGGGEGGEGGGEGGDGGDGGAVD
jgi:hypothetical protein